MVLDVWKDEEGFKLERCWCCGTLFGDGGLVGIAATGVEGQGANSGDEGAVTNTGASGARVDA